MISARIQLQTFQFCNVADLGACLAVSRGWHANGNSEPAWAAVYETTQRVDCGAGAGGTSQELRALIERPFGDRAVGWRVAVLHQEVGDEHFAEGHVTAYNAATDAYLVSYEGDDGTSVEVWEEERMGWSAAMERNPALAGRSRFNFVAPPGDTWPQFPPSAGCGRHAREGGSTSSSSLLRFGSWKEELKHNSRHAPSRLVQRITEHEDEVLYVAFSPCGSRLASCSRDRRTIIFRQSHGEGPHPYFVKEVELEHATAACCATWWPSAPYTKVLVMTEDTSYNVMLGESAIELWEVLPTSSEGVADGRVAEATARCLFRQRNYPFDIYTAIIAWPPKNAAIEPGVADQDRLCFLSGHHLWRESATRHIQGLDIWPGPAHPAFQGGVPVARLRVECGVNYLHGLEAGTEEMEGKLLALTGSTHHGHLCDELVLLDLCLAWERHDQGQDQVFGLSPTYVVHTETKSMGPRIILSARWSRRSDRILVNTRPYASRAASLAGCGGDGTESVQQEVDMLHQGPSPDLSTSIELLLLDARTMECLGTFDGHFAFTTKECPFKIYPEEWGDLDFLASGGEDRLVHIWHRRHRRRLRALAGHQGPVNSVSWAACGSAGGLLVSGSDDWTLAIWAAGSVVAPAGHAAAPV